MARRWTSAEDAQLRSLRRRHARRRDRRSARPLRRRARCATSGARNPATSSAAPLVRARGPTAAIGRRGTLAPYGAGRAARTVDRPDPCPPAPTRSRGAHGTSLHTDRGRPAARGVDSRHRGRRAGALPPPQPRGHAPPRAGTRPPPSRAPAPLHGRGGRDVARRLCQRPYLPAHRRRAPGPQRPAPSPRAPASSAWPRMPAIGPDWMTHACVAWSPSGLPPRSPKLSVARPRQFVGALAGWVW